LFQWFKVVGLASPKAIPERVKNCNQEKRPSLRRKAMDVFKLAFETVIVGLFALPCLLVMIDLTKPDLFSSSAVSHLKRIIPTELRPQAIALTLFPFAYLMGLVIAPVACEFLNDSDMLGGLLPNQDKIQALTYAQVDGPPLPGADMSAKVKPANYPGEARSDAAYDAETFRKAVHKEFAHEESTLLLRGPDGSGRVNRLHERMTVLQGATFSAFVLMVLCGFAWCGRRTNKKGAGIASPWEQVRRSLAFVLSLGFIILAAKELLNDVHHPESGDMPVAELVFIGLGSFGLYIAICGTRSGLHFHGLTFAVAFFFALVCYGGYASTETSYDQEIFNTYQALSPASAVDSSHAITKAAALATPFEQ
jgi:hypothetical protein